ncbi:MAG: carboxypeptidase-like regulatory domain-containing protein [Acidobacteriota bacterium]
MRSFGRENPKSRALVLLFCAVLAGQSERAAPSEVPGAATVNGAVFAEDSFPLGGVRVTAHRRGQSVGPESALEATTDARGTYEFGGLGYGLWRFEVHDLAGVDLHLDVEVPGDVSLPHAFPDRSRAVRVENQSNEKVVLEWRVRSPGPGRLWWASSFPLALTAGEGRQVRVAAGVVELTASCRGCSNEPAWLFDEVQAVRCERAPSGGVRMVAADADGLPLEQRADPPATSRSGVDGGGSWLRVEVFEESSKRTVAGAQVSVSSPIDYPTQTSSLGLSTIRGLEPGPVVVDIGAKGALSQRVEAVLEEGEHELRIALAPSSHLSGVVVDERSFPLPNVVVVARATDDDHESWTLETRTGADGSFLLMDVPASAFQLTASSDGYVPARFPRMLRPPRGSLTEPILLEKLASLAGTVSTMDSLPIQSAAIAAHLSEGGVRRARTDDRGRFEISGVGQSGEASLLVEAEGYVPRKLGRIAVESGEVHVRLRPAATIELHFFSSQGNGLEGIGVLGRLESPAGVRLASGLSDEDGRLVLRGLEPGSWLLSIEADPLQSRDVEVSAVAGEITKRNVTLHEGLELTGSVRSSSGDAVPHATVFVRSGPDRKRLQKTTADARGGFRFRGLPFGVCEVSASAVQGSTGTAEVDLNITNSVELVLPLGGTLFGTVVNSDGKPLGRVVVEALNADSPWVELASASFAATTRTGVDGTFEFSNLPERLTSVAIAGPRGKWVTPNSWRVRSGESTGPVEVVADFSASLVVAVEDSPRNTQVFAICEDPPMLLQQAVAGSSGETTFSNLQPGFWRVFGQSGKRSTPEVGVELRVGNESRLALSFSSQGSLSGTVDYGGAPAVGLEVRIADVEGVGGEMAFTDQSGGFSVEAIPKGAGLLIISDDYLGKVWTQRIHISGHESVHIELERLE